MTATWRIWATAGDLEATARTETLEEAQEIAASLPKALRIRPVRVYGRDNLITGLVTFHARLRADRSNGGRNEAGIARYRRLRTQLEVRGHEVEWTQPAGNCITEEELEALIDNEDEAAEAAAWAGRRWDA